MATDKASGDKSKLALATWILVTAVIGVAIAFVIGALVL